MFGSKSKRVSKPVMMKVGKGIIDIWTVGGDNYRIPIQGSAYHSSSGVDTVYDEFNGYRINRGPFISVSKTKLVSVATIKSMELVSIDMDFEVEVK